MAEQPQAQSKMGELFVDIGASGLGTLLKGLNSVSASFLLATKGAEAFIKPIKELSKQSTKSAVDYKKLGISLGASIYDVQKLKSYIKTKNLDESLLSDISNMQRTLYNLQNGYGGISSTEAIAWNRLGLTPTDYEPTLEGILRALQDMKESQENRGISDLDRVMELQMLNLDAQNLLYAWSRGDFNLNDAFLMSDEEAERLIEASESWNRLNNNLNMTLQKQAAKLAPVATNINNSLEKGLEYTVDPNMRNTINSYTPQAIGKPIGLETIPYDNSIYNESMETAALPSLPANITVNNENHFTVQDSVEAANAVNTLTAEQIRRGEYNQYQVHNRQTL